MSLIIQESPSTLVCKPFDEALEGKTPADACGIGLEGENKWLTVIRNAGRTEITD